ncbi:unnamed protein product [Rotaria sordida]|uniref:Uncharacterized protein n=1 Tax=Rotaria sordida TaxID=392033 RepID=A0A815CLC3_9BILA|nr:unnamed protein product [Rotaria sordida]CAF3788979.1 unnamed protein product [Rotaria sordida]
MLLFDIIYSSTLTNICPDTISCNCTLINNTDLNIICSSTPSLTQLPTLSPNTLQTNVKELRIISSITNTKGPLIALPTNICSYPNLATLDLSSNNISGLLNTSELACLGSNLIHVDFSYNNINDIDMNFFKANRQLQTINLSQNNLTLMPLIDGGYFVDFPSTIILMNFSFNQIVSVDFWPLFVKTRNTMEIDMSNNLVENYTNTVPISLEQFSETPDPRYFYLNNNRLNRLSDLLLEQYGACSTKNLISAAYFIVGISNVLLTNNQLICDCESYNLITYINDGINDFPEINNGTALLTQALCSLPLSMARQKYIFTSFIEYNNCENYTLPNITDIFCSLYINDSRVTLTTPTYWPSTTTTTYKYETNSTTGINNGNTNASSTSIAWYIILGIVLGLVVILAIIIAVFYLYQRKFSPKTYNLKTVNNAQTDEITSQKDFKLNEIKSRRVSMSTSTCEFDNQGKETQLGDDGLHLNLNLPKGHSSLNDENNPEQETQTCIQPIRSKPPTGRSPSTYGSQQIDNNHTQNTLQRKRKLSYPLAATDVATNTTNVVKGIPIPSVSTKPQSIFSNGTDTIPNVDSSQSNIASIPLVPSKRAKVLPQVKNGIYTDSKNDNLLNTTAGTLITDQRQRRRSSIWLRKQTQNMVSPLPPRPQSMVTRKHALVDSDVSCDESIHWTPTNESLTNKSSKPLRTVPLLNISVVPAWIDDSNDQM